jgi:hypothetical protein
VIAHPRTIHDLIANLNESASRFGRLHAKSRRLAWLNGVNK